MQRAKKHWLKLPDTLRRILVFILGGLLIITAGLIGPIPGPGGGIVFLLGIAVLATEFTWAERLRDYIFENYKKMVIHVKKRPVRSIIIGLIILVTGWVILFFTYKYFI